MGERLCDTGCGGQPRDVLLLCDGCILRLEQAIAEIPARMAELDITRTRQARIAQRNGGRSADTPLPFHGRAAEVADEVRATLVGCVRLLAGDDAGRYPADTVQAMAVWLTARVHVIAVHEAVADIWGSIIDVAETMRWVTDRPPDRLYAGVCGAELDTHPGWQCGEPLYARPGDRHVACRICSTVHDVDARRQEMLDALDGMLLTAAEIARLATYLIGDLGKGREQVRKLVNQWRRRGRLIGTSEEPPRFNFGEAKLLLAREQQRHAETVAS